jgi:hypothetical protein
VKRKSPIVRWGFLFANSCTPSQESNYKQNHDDDADDVEYTVHDSLLWHTFQISQGQLSSIKRFRFGVVRSVCFRNNEVNRPQQAPRSRSSAEAAVKAPDRRCRDEEYRRTAG